MIKPHGGRCTCAECFERKARTHASGRAAWTETDAPFGKPPPVSHAPPDGWGMFDADEGAPARPARLRLVKGRRNANVHSGRCSCAECFERREAARDSAELERLARMSSSSPTPAEAEARRAEMRRRIAAELDGKHEDNQCVSPQPLETRVSS